MRFWGFAMVILATTSVVWPGRTRAASIKLKTSSTFQPIKHISEGSQHSPASADPGDAAGRASARPKLYVQEPPARFQQGADGAPSTAALAFGYRSLGDTVSVQHELWASRWYNQDLWFTDQWRTSSLRTFNNTEADVVLVPASLAIRDVESQNAFIETAHTFLPMLDSKPHLVVLNHAATTYLTLKSTLFTHPNAQHFTYISLNPWAPAYEEEAVRQQKTAFAVESFQARLPEREVIFRSCQERPEACKHLDYEKEGAVAVWEAMQSAWYVLHPRGDFVNRAAWYDTVLANSIPVVFNREYIQTLPFAHILNYSRIMNLLPIEQLMAKDAPNAIDLLTSSFDVEQAAEKLRYISGIKQVFQYMLNPVHELIRWDQLGIIAEEDDAFTMTMKAALRNMCMRHLLHGDRCKASGA